MKSFRNLERVDVTPADNTGVADIVRAAQVVFSRTALDAITELARKPSRRTATTTGDES